VCAACRVLIYLDQIEIAGKLFPNPGVPVGGINFSGTGMTQWRRRTIEQAAQSLRGGIAATSHSSDLQHSTTALVDRELWAAGKGTGW